MQRLDLTFVDAPTEDAFRCYKLGLLPWVASVEAVRVAVGLIIVLKLATQGSAFSSSPLFAIMVSVTAMLLLLARRSPSLRLRYVVSVVGETLMVILGSAIAPNYGWQVGAGGRASPSRALAEVATMNGSPLWLFFTLSFSPLPFRLLFPVLVTQSAVLLLQAPRMCLSAGLQQGYALIHHALLRAARRCRLQTLLLQLATAAAHPGAAASDISSASTHHHLCAGTYQPVAVVCGALLLGYLAFSVELSQRADFLRRRGSAGRQQPLRAHHGLLLRPRDFWVFFGLPLVSLFSFLHLSLLQTH